MEGSPPTPELSRRSSRRTGYPRAAFHTFAEHAELDPGHRDHLDRILDSLPLTAEQEAVLAISAIRPPSSPHGALEELLGR